MSKSVFSKTSALLVSLSILAISTYPALAKDATTGAINRRAVIQQKVETAEGVTATGRLLGPEEKVVAVSQLGVMKDKMASRAAALKTKLQTFKDQRKANLAERISDNLNRINQNFVSQFQRYLGTMSTILDKLENRVNQGTPDIKDPASARTAIASARASIASASAAISTQTLKDYTLQVSSEAKVKTDAKTQRDKLHTDLRALRKAVIDAKQAVVNAIRVAKMGPSANPFATSSGAPKEGTTSGQQ